MFAKDVVGCFCHGSVKAVDQGVYFGVLIFKGEEWSKYSSYRCSKNVCDVGVLGFFQTEPDPYVALVFHRLEAESEGHYYKLVVTSSISSWKAPGLCNVRTWLEASFDHAVVDLIVVVSSWAVPCPASRWFVWTKCVRHLQVVVTGYDPPFHADGTRDTTPGLRGAARFP